jgi:hypothetical protein
MATTITDPLKKPSDRGFIITAWMLTFLVPIIGLICGIILTVRRHHVHGVLIMIIAPFMIMFEIALGVINAPLHWDVLIIALTCLIFGIILLTYREYRGRGTLLIAASVIGFACCILFNI